jgi:hypothetical protein
MKRGTFNNRLTIPFGSGVRLTLENQLLVRLPFEIVERLYREEYPIYTYQKCIKQGLM